MSAYNAFEPPIIRPLSPTSNVPGADDEESSTDDGGDDDDHHDVSSKISEDENDHDGAGRNRKAPNATGILSGVPYTKPFRESRLLLQMVPYNPGGAAARSDRLIRSGEGADSGTASATQEVTRSVRALLDKWTTSGSAPISNILDQEAARESDEALVPGPSLTLDLANIILPVSWPISIDIQALNTIGIGSRHPLFILLLRLTQNFIDILLLLKVIVYRHVCHHTERWTSQYLFLTALDHQVDD